MLNIVKGGIIINIYDIWFSNIDISNNIKIKLLKYFKNSKTIWELKKQELSNFMLSEKSISKILDINSKLDLTKYAKYIEKNNIKLIRFDDTAYPSSLKNIYDLPAYLYIRGNINNLYDDCIAIVGSRNASDYGKYVSKKIAKEVADKNVNIVSGLALGIDKYAHLGALESKIGKTIAVLGTGVSNEEMYPLENKRVFERILENNGTIVSEFKLGTKPEKFNFPKRNRIISGLSKKIVVVEAKENSGSLITADFALEQGKDIFAVPGNINSKNSLGTNKLISEGAYLLTNSNDLFYL